MRTFMNMTERVAKHVGTVLIVGETGVGKEMIARAIHQHSTRCGKPLVEINCAALPENLVESELFGYEKGAFSGADAVKPGFFEVADTGTIFLDEIGELDLRLQVKLLRVLDKAPYYRLGGQKKITTDVRVIAATNRILKDEINAGRFRKDLYHRLSQFELRVPSLRERPEDITALADHFLRKGAVGLSFDADAVQILRSYAWPGNVRELQNLVNKLTVSCAGPQITSSDVSRELNIFGSTSPPPSAEPGPPTELKGLETEAIQKALQITGGHQGRAAQRLGISRRTLGRRLRQKRGQVETDATPDLGSFNYEQQRAFRAEVTLPVLLRSHEGQEYVCTAVNLSAGGMGLQQFFDSPSNQTQLTAIFRLPGLDVTWQVPALLSWTGANGRAGVTFIDMPGSNREELGRWLLQKASEEGWTVSSGAKRRSSGSTQSEAAASSGSGLLITPQSGRTI